MPKKKRSRRPRKQPEPATGTNSQDKRDDGGEVSPLAQPVPVVADVKSVMPPYSLKSPARTTDPAARGYSEKSSSLAGRKARGISTCKGRGRRPVLSVFERCPGKAPLRRRRLRGNLPARQCYRLLASLPGMPIPL